MKAFVKSVYVKKSMYCVCNVSIKVYSRFYKICQTLGKWNDTLNVNGRIDRECQMSNIHQYCTKFGLFNIHIRYNCHDHWNVENGNWNVESSYKQIIQISLAYIVRRTCLSIYFAPACTAILSHGFVKSINLYILRICVFCVYLFHRLAIALPTTKFVV